MRLIVLLSLIFITGCDYKPQELGWKIIAQTRDASIRYTHVCYDCEFSEALQDAINGCEQFSEENEKCTFYSIETIKKED